MTTAGSGASSCCLALLSTNLAYLQPSRDTSKPLPWLMVVVPLLCYRVREGPAAKPCLPRVFSLPAGHNLRTGLQTGLQGMVERAKLGSLEGVELQACVGSVWALWGWLFLSPAGQTEVPIRVSALPMVKVALLILAPQEDTFPPLRTNLPNTTLSCLWSRLWSNICQKRLHENGCVECRRCQRQRVKASPPCSQEQSWISVDAGCLSQCLVP